MALNINENLITTSYQGFLKDSVRDCELVVIAANNCILLTCLIDRWH